MVIYYLGEHVMYQDETLICEDCGCEFVFTAGEQEFYAEKGLTNKPKRCANCRKAAVAGPAVRTERMRSAAPVRCMMRFALNVENKRKYLLTLHREEMFSAKNVLMLKKRQVQFSNNKLIKKRD